MGIKGVRSHNQELTRSSKLELAQNLSQTKVNKSSLYVTLIKVTVSLFLLGLLLYKSNLDKYLDIVQKSSPIYLLLALLVTVLSILLSAYKWQILVHAQGFRVPLRNLTASYFVGLFFNNFMPTSIGGDLVRVYDLRKMIKNGPAAAASVVAERVLASFTLGLIVLCGVMLSSGLAAKYKLLVLVFVALCIVALLGILQAHRLGSFLSRFEAGLLKKAGTMIDSVRSCISHKPSLVMVLVYSLAFQFMVVAINMLIAKALGLHVPVAYALLSIPIIFAITMLPVSMNGLGVREAGYVYFFSQVGLSTEEAVAISIFFFLVVTLVSLIGGGIFALRK